MTSIEAGENYMCLTNHCIPVGKSEYNLSITVILHKSIQFDEN
jgi:hypothetical protein